MLTTRIRRIGTAALGAAVLCVLLAHAAVAQVATGDIQSVGMSPTESKPDDPNAGQWFVFSAGPGHSVTTQARITNPADVAQTVKLYMVDLVFGADGAPTIPDKTPYGDVGAWGRFGQDSITVPPRSDVNVSIALTVPENAEPGDHVGAAVAESQPIGSTTVKVVKRLAVRVYVTVPGDATKSFSVVKLSKKLSSTWWPRQLAVTALLRNTGRVRIHPKVTVKGTKATGTDPLLARSVEYYTAKLSIPWYGGPVSLPVSIASDAGNKQLSTSMFVIPWGPLAMIPLAFLVLLALKFLWRLRTRKMRGLQADLKRLEKLVAERQTGAAAAKATLAKANGHANANGHDASDASDEHDEEETLEAERIRSIRAGIKRARRNHSQEPLERLALALHDSGEDALNDLLAALEKAEPPARDMLVAAAASYGPTRLEAMPTGSVPADVLMHKAAAAKSTTPRPRKTRAASGSARAESGAGTAPDSARKPPSSTPRPRRTKAGTGPRT